MSELEEYRQEVVGKFDEWLMRTENRGISYGELAHLESLNKQELARVEQELEQELASVEQGWLDQTTEPTTEMMVAAQEMEQAHEAWLKEKEHKLHTLRLTAELCRLSDMPNTADDLEAIADFFEKGEC